MPRSLAPPFQRGGSDTNPKNNNQSILKQQPVDDPTATLGYLPTRRDGADIYGKRY